MNRKLKTFSHILKILKSALKIGVSQILNYKFRLLFVVVMFVFAACGDTYIPRPYGYFRVDLPEHSYRQLDTLSLPYRFDVPQIARIVSRETAENKHWIDIQYPTLNGSIYCSYKPIKGDMFELSEEARKIVYKHNVRADGIGESAFEHPEQRVYSVLYNLEGNTASPIQFVVTDSVRHFLRASLYFDNVPNKDSIAPMVQYVREDIVRLIESFEWKR